MLASITIWTVATILPPNLKPSDKWVRNCFDDFHRLQQAPCRHSSSRRRPLQQAPAHRRYRSGPSECQGVGHDTSGTLKHDILGPCGFLVVNAAPYLRTNKLPCHIMISYDLTHPMDILPSSVKNFTLRLDLEDVIRFLPQSPDPRSDLQSAQSLIHDGPWQPTEAALGFLETISSLSRYRFSELEEVVLLLLLANRLLPIQRQEARLRVQQAQPNTIVTVYMTANTQVTTSLMIPMIWVSAFRAHHRQRTRRPRSQNQHSVSV